MHLQNFIDFMPITHVKSFTHGPFATNSYVCNQGSEAVIVDASCSNDQEEIEIAEYIKSNRLTVRHLLLTHAHIDHILGCRALSKRFNLLWQSHPDTSIWLEGAPAQALLYGFTMEPLPKPGKWIQEQNLITFGEAKWRILYTPGHAPGSICFVDDMSQFVIAGDVLFQQSIGRTDLPGGDMGTLMKSIHQQLLPLPDEMIVYAGHGPPTKIGLERIQNPFLQ